MASTRPLLESCAQFGDSHFSKGTEKMVRVQDRAQKMSQGVESGTSGKKLKWMWMIYLRQRKMIKYQYFKEIKG